MWLMSILGLDGIWSACRLFRNGRVGNARSRRAGQGVRPPTVEAV